MGIKQGRRRTNYRFVTGGVERADTGLLLFEKILGQGRQRPDAGNIGRHIGIHFQPWLGSARAHFNGHAVRVDGNLHQLTD